MAKYVFVTGGVVSSVGKGISSAAVGRLLHMRGLTVTSLKLDPYLNIDPGTMNPYQHGECFVTNDGAETDLDLGHYERIMGVDLNRDSSVTAGQVFDDILQRERRGDFAGSTIQFVPHITNAIKSRIHAVGRIPINMPSNNSSGVSPDVVIVEVGGTVGDIEGQPFLESLRQLHRELGPGSCVAVHVTYLPFIPAAGEIKTKPTQHSVQELRRLGLQPDILICRVEDVSAITPQIREKLATFCDVDPRSVILLPTVASIYEVPLVLHQEGIDEAIARVLYLPRARPEIGPWRALVERIKSPRPMLPIAVVGKYVTCADAYISVREALGHAGVEVGVVPEIRWIDAETLAPDAIAESLRDIAGVIVPGGFGSRGVEGKIGTARYCREQKIPYFGLCLGMQVMMIELARAQIDTSANSTEFSPDTPTPVIDYLPDQRPPSVDGKPGMGQLGGTLRLGQYPCRLQANTRAAKAYNTAEIIYERHRHRYEVNNRYRRDLEEAGVVFSGVSPDGLLVEVAELRDHPWMLGTQYHPEFRSRPDRPHPLFVGFMRAALEHQQRRKAQSSPILSDA